MIVVAVRMTSRTTINLVSFFTLPTSSARLLTAKRFKAQNT
ncbi:hypothetical protein [Rhizobium laguerreae]|nr:hypothetical protein [Rhizobium laguerreae]